MNKRRNILNIMITMVVVLIAMTSMALADGSTPASTAPAISPRAIFQSYLAEFSKTQGDEEAFASARAATIQYLVNEGIITEAQGTKMLNGECGCKGECNGECNGTTCPRGQGMMGRGMMGHRMNQ